MQLTRDLRIMLVVPCGLRLGTPSCFLPALTAVGSRLCFTGAVQHECIPQAILGMDILCQAKSGMGKTAVFVLSVLQQIETDDKEEEATVKAVVLCHTRELAFQARFQCSAGLVDATVLLMFAGTAVLPFANHLPQMVRSSKCIALKQL